MEMPTIRGFLLRMKFNMEMKCHSQIFYLDLKNFNAFGADIDVFYKSEDPKLEAELVKSYYVSIRSVNDHDWDLVDEADNVSILSGRDFFYHDGSVDKVPETHFEIIAECMEVAEMSAIHEKYGD